MARLRNGDDSVSVSSSSKKSSSALVVGIVFGVIALVLVITVIAFAFSPSQTTENTTNAQRDILVTPDNVEEILAEIQETNPDSAYTASMNIDWYFEDGASPSSNAYVENAVENSRTVYFEVFLADTKELVYSSPYIPVGSTLEHPALIVDLDAGDYDGICVYHLVDDNNVELSTVSVAVTLHILN